MTQQFKQQWITLGADAEMIAFAEELGKDLAQKGVTSSQFRNVYGEIKRIQALGWEKGKSAFYLLMPKMAYAIGRSRDKGTKDSKTSTEGLMELKTVIQQATEKVNDDSTLNNFCNLVESILAFHKEKSVEKKIEDERNRSYYDDKPRNNNYGFKSKKY